VVRPNENSAVVRVGGEIGITSGLAFKEHLFAVLDEGRRRSSST
jgi:hypothetical protein